LARRAAGGGSRSSILPIWAGKCRRCRCTRLALMAMAPWKGAGKSRS